MSRQRTGSRVRALETWSETRFPMDLVQTLAQEFDLPRARIITVMQEEIRIFQKAGTWERHMAALAQLRNCSVSELRSGCTAFLARTR